MPQQSVDTVINSIKKRNIFVDILIILFGISSWIGVTSVYVELPLIILALRVPEGWSFASYMVFVVQSANIITFAYVLYQKYSPKKINDAVLIYITLFIGCTAAICTVFFDKEFTAINGTKHSVALLTFCFMFALVGCLSSVLFMPYCGRFRECYLMSYMFGMALNGFIPSILALIQGVGRTECVPVQSPKPGGPNYIESQPSPLFSTEVVFMIIFGIMLISTIAFTLLNHLGICRKEYAAVTIETGNCYKYDESDITDQNQHLSDEVVHLSMFNRIFLLLVVAVLSGFGNGILPGLMTYSCLPYGNNTYHFAVILAAIVQPCAGLIAMLLPHTSIRIIRVFSFIGTVLAVYIFFIATQSPKPLFQHSIIGDILIVSINYSS